ncbi:MAG: hypothetical protein ACYC6C_12430 [Coriobacteriia bacterium]
MVEGTLVLVQHNDETRFELGWEQGAIWARAAIEEFLAAGVHGFPAGCAGRSDTPQG